ncbi:hypothetical protein BDW22DRAFT_1354634 [Trametopsis cervina]|nr:hypothetical protein BDW22DRAFT_1354634 [Trametopsis cervina]
MESRDIVWYPSNRVLRLVLTRRIVPQPSCSVDGRTSVFMSTKRSASRRQSVHLRRPSSSEQGSSKSFSTMSLSFWQVSPCGWCITPVGRYGSAGGRIHSGPCENGSAARSRSIFLASPRHVVQTSWTAGVDIHRPCAGRSCRTRLSICATGLEFASILTTASVKSTRLSRLG